MDVLMQSAFFLSVILGESVWGSGKSQSEDLDNSSHRQTVDSLTN